MADSRNQHLPPLSAWQMVNMRLTAFLMESSKLSPEEWWSELVGGPPDDVSSRPKAGHHRQTGLLEGRRLVLGVQPDRVDWVVTPAVEPSDEPETLPTAGSFSEAITSFQRLALAWLRNAPPIARLAFGATLVQPVKDRRTGYLEIAKYLPFVRLDPDRSSDFLYQINRPRDAAIPIESLRINRLMKWSVMLFGRFSLDFGKTEVTSRGYLSQDSACRLELDINTAPDFAKELPKEKIVDLFGELVLLAKEIAEKGDVP